MLATPWARRRVKRALANTPLLFSPGSSPNWGRRRFQAIGWIAAGSSSHPGQTKSGSSRSMGLSIMTGPPSVCQPWTKLATTRLGSTLGVRKHHTAVERRAVVRCCNHRASGAPTKDAAEGGVRTPFPGSVLRRQILAFSHPHVLYELRFFLRRGV